MAEEGGSLFNRPWLRAALVVVALLIAFFVVRDLAMPESFGQYGYYRGDNVDEWAVKPVAYSPGAQTCEKCHQDKYTQWSAGQHAGFGCETCHGPAQEHQSNPGKVRPALPVEREFCGVCHDTHEARVELIRQVDINEHNRGTACVACHDPHRPLPLRVGGKS